MAAEAARVALDAGVERLEMIHVRPGAEDDRLVDEARSVFDASVIGTDLLRLD